MDRQVSIPNPHPSYEQRVFVQKTGEWMTMEELVAEAVKNSKDNNDDEREHYGAEDINYRGA